MELTVTLALRWAVDLDPVLAHSLSSGEASSWHTGRKQRKNQKTEMLELVCHGLIIPWAVFPKSDDGSGSDFYMCCTANLSRQGKSVGKSVRDASVAMKSRTSMEVGHLYYKKRGHRSYTRQQGQLGPRNG